MTLEEIEELIDQADWAQMESTSAQTTANTQRILANETRGRADRAEALARHARELADDKSAEAYVELRRKYDAVCVDLELEQRRKQHLKTRMIRVLDSEQELKQKKVRLNERENEVLEAERRVAA